MMPGDIEHWDAFVSHASEDKDSFVRPLVEALGRLSVSLWYDEVSLRLGDSLSGSIDRGIAKSRNGIVVVSPAFLKKRWPEAELHALNTRRIEDGYLCIRTGSRQNDVVVPNFFPAVRAMLDADFPSSDEISSNFAAAGFAPRHREIVTEVVAP